MKYSEAKRGRTFVIRLEDGDIVHESIIRLAKEQNVTAGSITILGGADIGSRLVVGPEGDGRQSPVTPQTTDLKGVNEIAGVGTLFPNEAGEPVLHLHMACGREEKTITGCIRQGVRVWHVMEAILIEILETDAIRKNDSTTGFELLHP